MAGLPSALLVPSSQVPSPTLYCRTRLPPPPPGPPKGATRARPALPRQPAGGPLAPAPCSFPRAPPGGIPFPSPGPLPPTVTGVLAEEGCWMKRRGVCEKQVQGDRQGRVESPLLAERREGR